MLRKDLDTGLDLLADVLLHPAFKPEELARRREAVLASIRADEDDPTDVAQKAFQRALFGDTPYGHPDEGTEASVRAHQPRRRAGLLRRTTTARAAPPSSSSATSRRPRHANASRARSATGAARRCRRLSIRRSAEPPAPTHLRIDRPVTQAGIVMGNLGIARDNPDYEALAVMNYVLGSGGFSSRLMDNIRTQAGLAYSVGSFFAASKSPGPFEIVMQTKNASVDRRDRARPRTGRSRSAPSRSATTSCRRPSAI